MAFASAVTDRHVQISCTQMAMLIADSMSLAMDSFGVMFGTVEKRDVSEITDAEANVKNVQNRVTIRYQHYYEQHELDPYAMIKNGRQVEVILDHCRLNMKFRERTMLPS
jgi:hypothetical protein